MIYEVILSPEFAAWLDGLREVSTRMRLVRRIERIQSGNFGDVKPVGHGVFELREDFGPGWRLYYSKVGKVVVVMLAGGNKSSQAADIKKAIRIAKEIEP